ncbi:conserved hypothetical protein [Candidatus Terasakiella magnetica]|nr:conserved hypothetical protein [Candidatus Terasakiella magnetica]
MSKARSIYHVCRRIEWLAPSLSEGYRGSSQDEADGFIHFSTAAQVQDSVAKHRAGQDGLVLIAVDADRLGGDLRWEPSRGGALFPHLYGPLPPDAVKWVADLPLDRTSNRHIFPPIED